MIYLTRELSVRIVHSHNAKITDHMRMGPNFEQVANASLWGRRILSADRLIAITCNTWDTVDWTGVVGRIMSDFSRSYRETVYESGRKLSVGKTLYCLCRFLSRRKPYILGIYSLLLDRLSLESSPGWVTVPSVYGVDFLVSQNIRALSVRSFGLDESNADNECILLLSSLLFECHGTVTKLRK